jgi:DNA-binding CsgD family transcriptional regulator
MPRLSPLEEKILHYIKYHKIKNNRQLALLLGTSPNVIAVIKYRLMQKGFLTREEALERLSEKYYRKQRVAKKTRKTLIDLLK